MTGLLVTIDGPGGTGKSTTTLAVTAELQRRGRLAHATAGPSSGPVGALARSLVNELDSHALACLVAADRYHHLAAEIRPSLVAGHAMFSAAADLLTGRGVPVIRIDTSRLTPQQAAAQIADAAQERCASLTRHG